MAVGGREEEEQGQARAAAQERVDAIAPQQGACMMVWGVADGRIRVAAAPGQDGGAIEDEVAPVDEASVQRQADEDDEQALARRGAGVRPPAALLGGAGHPGTPLGIGREATGEREGGPCYQPVMQVLI